MNKKAVYSIIAVVVIGALVFIGFRMTSNNSEDDNQQPQIKTTKVKKGSVNSSFSATGIVVSAKQVDLNFNDPGLLEELEVSLNEKVEEDQDLARLDPTNTMLGDEVLESPISGTVINIEAKEGEIVSSTVGGSSATATATSAGTIETSGFMTIADLSDLQIKMSIDQADIKKVSKGQKVNITLDALEDEEYSGKVISIDPVPSNDQNVITYTAYAGISKIKSSLRLGMSANIELEYGKKDNVLIVPNDAVRSRDGRKIVLVMSEDGRPQPVDVKVGEADEKNTEIISGLKEGDEIISGRPNLTGGGGRGGFPFGPRGGRGGGGQRGGGSGGPPH